MNLHIVHDPKFIRNSFELFEKYYPKENYFIVLFSKKAEELALLDRERIIELNFRSCLNLFSLIRLIYKKEINLFIHNLDELKSTLVLFLLPFCKAKIYWIFFGVELYSDLQKRGIYDLKDYELKGSSDKKGLKKLKSKVYNTFKNGPGRVAKEKLIRKLDYFCFWNHFDYRLLKQHFRTDAEFKFFRFYELKADNFSLEKALKSKQSETLLVNHSASQYGNHISVLKKLKELDKKCNLRKVYTPLSYGNKRVREQVNTFGLNKLQWCFESILNFVPKQKYFQLLRTIPTAIFGHRRQEGAGSVFYLLASGTKIFLREENNMFSFLKERGYKVFSFDTELEKYDDLFSFSYEDQFHNYQLASEDFSQQEIDKTYRNLID